MTSIAESHRYGVFVALGIAALTYIGLSLASSREREPATAMAD